MLSAPGSEWTFHFPIFPSHKFTALCSHLPDTPVRVRLGICIGIYRRLSRYDCIVGHLCWYFDGDDVLIIYRVWSFFGGCFVVVDVRASSVRPTDLGVILFWACGGSVISDCPIQTIRRTHTFAQTPAVVLVNRRVVYTYTNQTIISSVAALNTQHRTQLHKAFERREYNVYYVKRWQ